MYGARESVLTNEYLLRRIFSHFNSGKSCDIRRNKKHISFAALTCRAFAKPARDAQWDVLTSLRPLFRFLEKGWDDLGIEFHFSGSEHAENLDRFREIARKVRTLYYYPTNRLLSTPVSGEAIAKASEADSSTVSEQRFLLPGLRTLHCSVPVEWLGDLVFLASPSLYSIFLHPDTPMDYAVQSISPFQSITVLSVGGNPSAIGNRFLEELSRLHHLESIQLRFNKFATAGEFTNSRPFPISWKCESVTTLKTVHITGMPSGISVFMEGLEGCALTSLLINILVDPDQPTRSLHDIDRLGKSLPMAGKESLETLFITDRVSLLPTLRRLGAPNEVNEYRRIDLVSSNAFIDCFLQFRNLKTLRYVGNGFRLHESEVDAITQSTSWRETLHEFRIPCERFHCYEKGYNTSPPDLRQLQKLVSALPNLKILDLYFQLDEKDIPPPSSCSLDPERVSQLEVLYIETDYFVKNDAIVPIAEYLDSFLPNLRNIQSYRLTERRDLWKAVLKTMLLCQRVRKRALGLQA